MYCPNCGCEIFDDQNFCGNCGEGISNNSIDHFVETGVKVEPTEPLTVKHKVRGKGLLFNFPHASSAEVSGKIADLFQKEGYRLEEGTPFNGIYGIGSGGRRLLVGALAKRYRFEIFIYEKDGITVLEIYKAMSGVSGGLLGVQALNKEYDRICEQIQNGFNF